MIAMQNHIDFNHKNLKNISGDIVQNRPGRNSSRILSSEGGWNKNVWKYFFLK